MLSLAYVAGIIDGEGCIMFKYRSNRPNIALEVVVQVRMVEPIIPELLREQFGGNLTYVDASKNPRARANANWSISYTKAIEFLKEIRPYLILKKNQAALAITYHSVRQEIDEDGKLAFKQAMHSLNTRGKEPSVKVIPIQERAGN